MQSQDVQVITMEPVTKGPTNGCIGKDLVFFFYPFADLKDREFNSGEQKPPRLSTHS